MLIADASASLLSVFNIESLIRYGGLLLVFLAVYGQTGLFFCFFLPSGGLMFTTGVFVASGVLQYNIFIVCSLLTIASLLGNITGYWVGRRTGPVLRRKKDSRFFKQRYLEAAENFYKKFGGMALMVGLFFPLIRTFGPVVAGVVKMDLRKFVLFTFVGSLTWVSCFVLAGYLIASMPFLKPYLGYMITTIIILVTIPTIIRIIKELKKPDK